QLLVVRPGAQAAGKRQDLGSGRHVFPRRMGVLDTCSRGDARELSSSIGRQATPVHASGRRASSSLARSPPRQASCLRYEAGRRYVDRDGRSGPASGRRLRDTRAGARTMTATARPTVLCLSSYFKGNRFLQACKRAGCRVYLLTVENLLTAEWA